MPRYIVVYTDDSDFVTKQTGVIADTREDAHKHAKRLEERYSAKTHLVFSLKEYSENKHLLKT